MKNIFKIKENVDMSEKTDESKVAADAGTEQDLADALKGKDWKKVLFVLLITIVLYLEVIYLVPLLVLISVVLYLLKGEVDPRVATFSGALVGVITGSLNYVLFHSNDKPWPLSPWPSKDSAAEAVDQAVQSSATDVSKD